MGAWCPAPVAGPAGRRAPGSPRPPDRPGLAPAPPHPGWSSDAFHHRPSPPDRRPVRRHRRGRRPRPRFLQATVGAGAALALLTGWWWLYGLLALQLVAGLVLGRRWCCRAWPTSRSSSRGSARAGSRTPGRPASPTRSARPCSASPSPPTWPGWTGPGRRSGPWSRSWPCWPPPPACASAASCTSWRRGCGVRPGTVGALDLAAVGAAPGGRPWSSSPTRCAATATSWRSAWPAGPAAAHRRRVAPADLARRYHVAVVPAAFRVAGDGTVLERLA